MAINNYILPTFLVIGVGRSGTSWIYEVLRAHRDVCMAAGTKETLFFDREYHRGLEWYSQFFANCRNAYAVGEVSNSYMFNENVATRIKSLLPDVLLICCLRNPIERMQSVYFYRKRSGTIKGDISEAIRKHPELITDNFYWTQIQRFVSLFDKKQINILFYDDLRANPEAFAEDLYRIVGVEETFSPHLVEEKINVSAEARLPVLGLIAKSTAVLLRQAGLYSLLESLKRNRLLRSVVLRPMNEEEKNIISEDLRRKLISSFEDEIRGIADFTGRNLDHWLGV
jgi:hypothetical protein